MRVKAMIDKGREFHKVMHDGRNDRRLSSKRHKGISIVLLRRVWLARVDAWHQWQNTGRFFVTRDFLAIFGRLFSRDRDWILTSDFHHRTLRKNPTNQRLWFCSVGPRRGIGRWYSAREFEPRLLQAVWKRFHNNGAPLCSKTTMMEPP